jgi:hypothetical protein
VSLKKIVLTNVCMVESFMARPRAAPLGTAPPAIAAPALMSQLDDVGRRCQTTRR